MRFIYSAATRLSVCAFALAACASESSGDAQLSGMENADADTQIRAIPVANEQAVTPNDDQDGKEAESQISLTRAAKHSKRSMNISRIWRKMERSTCLIGVRSARASMNGRCGCPKRNARLQRARSCWRSMVSNADPKNEGAAGIFPHSLKMRAPLRRRPAPDQPQAPAQPRESRAFPRSRAHSVTAARGEILHSRGRSRRSSRASAGGIRAARRY